MKVVMSLSMYWCQCKMYCFHSDQQLWMVYSMHRLKTKITHHYFPFIVLFPEDRSHQADHRRFIGKDTYHIGPSSILLVQPFEHVVGIDPLPVFDREAHIRQNIVFSFEQDLGCVQPSGLHGIIHRLQLPPGRFLLGWA